MAKKKVESSPSKVKKAPRESAEKAPKAASTPPTGGSSAEAKKRASNAADSAKAPLSSDAIGQTAGDVWTVLSDRGEQTVAGLKKAVNASDELVVAALGWLARENKLAFSAKGKSVSVSLL